MVAHISGEWSWLQVIVMFAAGLVMRCSAMDTTELERLMVDAILLALNGAHIAHKQAADHMGIDPEQLRRQLHLEPKQYVALSRLLRLPFAFWLHFGPSLIQIVYRKRMAEFAESINDMKRPTR